MKKFIVVILSCFMVITVGCSSSKENESSEYRQLYSGEIKTLNYLVTAEEVEFGAVANFIDTLVDYDKYGVVKPCLAEKWNVSDDGLVWTFKLRKDVKWVSNIGEEYAETVAQDFVDSMKYVLDPKNESATANIAYSVIKNAEEYYNGDITDFGEVGVKAIDKYTLEYTLEKPTPYFLSMLTYVCFFPVNGDFLKESGELFGTDNSKILYNGAYIMDTFEPQSRRIYKANSQYWDKKNVFIKTINCIYNKEAVTLAPEMLLRGEIDYAGLPTSIVDEWMKDDSKKSMMRPILNTFYSYFYAFNFDPQFDEEYEPDNWKIVVNNLSFRKSIFHGLDRVAAMLTTEPYNPESKLQNTITPKDFVNLNGVDYTQLGKLGEISSTDSFDANLAKEYRDKAKKELSGKATFPIKVLMPYNTSGSDWANRAQVIEQQLENLLGTDYIDVIIEPKPPTGFLKDVRRSGNYALLECNWGPDYADPETYTDPFYPGGTYNWPELAEGYKESNGKNKYTNLVDNAKSESIDIEKRYNSFAEAESFLINEAFVIPYSVGGKGYVSSKLDPFESQYSPFGVASYRYKGQKILDKPMSMDEFNKKYEKWESERKEALKNVEE